MIPLELLVLLALAVYRLTLLCLYDRITRRPRTAVKAWLLKRAHHEVEAPAERSECSCGWSAQILEHQSSGRYLLQITYPVPRGMVMPESALLESEAIDRTERALTLHIRQGTDTSRLGYLIECPWCLSMWIGAAATAVAWAWPDGWWRWPALALAASAVTGFLATLAHPDDDDEA